MLTARAEIREAIGCTNKDLDMQPKTTEIFTLDGNLIAGTNRDMHIVWYEQDYRLPANRRGPNEPQPAPSTTGGGNYSDEGNL